MAKSSSVENKQTRRGRQTSRGSSFIIANRAHLATHTPNPTPPSSSRTHSPRLIIIVVMSMMEEESAAALNVSMCNCNYIMCSSSHTQSECGPHRMRTGPNSRLCHVLCMSSNLRSWKLLANSTAKLSHRTLSCLISDHFKLCTHSLLISRSIIQWDDSGSGILTTTRCQTCHFTGCRYRWGAT